MPVAVPLILGAASLGSAAIGASAANKAANAQAAAASNALEFQKSVFDQNQQNYQAARANFDPYLNIGKGATYSLGSLYGIGQDGLATNANADYSQFYNSPDYAFAQQQGQLGLDRYEASKGMSLSGGALKDVAQFNQGLATQQFGNYFNRLLSLSQLGQGAATGVGNLTAGQANSNNAAASSIGNTQQGVGQAQAAGYVGSANAITGAVNGGIQNSLLYNALNRSSYAPASAGMNFGNIGGTGGFLGGLF